MDKRKAEQISQQKTKVLAQKNEYQKLLHRVFVQSEDGVKLLEQWLHIAMMTEGHLYGKEPYDIGRAEGRKEFVREIFLQSKQAEER